VLELRHLLQPLSLQQLLQEMLPLSLQLLPLEKLTRLVQQLLQLSQLVQELHRQNL
jgi:hypothetical protein